MCFIIEHQSTPLGAKLAREDGTDIDLYLSRIDYKSACCSVLYLGLLIRVLVKQTLSIIMNCKILSRFRDFFKTHSDHESHSLNL